MFDAVKTTGQGATPMGSIDGVNLSVAFRAYFAWVLGAWGASRWLVVVP